MARRRGRSGKEGRGRRKGRGRGGRRSDAADRDRGGDGRPRRAFLAVGAIFAVMLLVLAVGVYTDWFHGSFYDDDEGLDEVEFGSGGDGGGDDDGGGDEDDGGGGGAGGGGDTVTYPDPDDRVVLAEDFTNTGCPPCATADPELDRAAAKFGTGKLAYIRYHVWWPEESDPFYKALKDRDVKARAQDKYGVSGVPSVFVDGKVVSFQSDYYNDLVDAVDARLDRPPGFNIAGGAVVQDGDGQLDVTLTQVDDILKGTRLHALLVETGIPYKASNGEEIHNYVVRKFIIPGEGEPVNVGPGGEFALQREFEVPGDMEQDNAWVVVFVQNEDGTGVHNAQVIDIQAPL